jgi:hypothetical protein
MPLRWTPAALAVVLLLAACKGAGSSESTPQFDVDPFVLLPASAFVVAHVDAHAAFNDPSVGPALAGAAQTVVPLGDDAGVQAARDVDRVVVAAFGGNDMDFAVVLAGRFDPASIRATTRARNGGPVVAADYAGFVTLTSGSIVIAPLTRRTVLAGSAGGVHLVLDRVHAGQLTRALPPWMTDTLATQGAEVAVAADFASQPAAAAVLASVNVPWLQGLRLARAVANFGPPGMNVGGTLTYGDAAHADAATEGARRVGQWVKALGPILGGVELQQLDVHTEGSDTRCSFSLDDRTLRALAALLPRVLPSLRP